MSFSYDDLQAVLVAWPDASLPASVEDSLLDRICQILASAKTHPESQIWQADLQPLLRHQQRSAAAAARIIEP